MPSRDPYLRSMGGGLRECRGRGDRAGPELSRAGSCPGGVQPVIKPVIAIAGDVLEIGPDAVIVTGQRLPSGASAPSIALAGHYQTWAGAGTRSPPVSPGS